MRARPFFVSEYSTRTGVSGMTVRSTMPFLESLTDITLMTVQLAAAAKWRAEVPRGHNIFFYVVRGEVSVFGEPVRAFNLASFNDYGDALIIFGHAKPYREPVVSYERMSE